jgi:hypothetical protein
VLPFWMCCPVSQHCRSHLRRGQPAARFDSYSEVWGNTGVVRNAVGVLLVCASCFVLAACGSAGAGTLMVKGRTTAIIAHPKIGTLVRCKMPGGDLRAKIPPSGEHSMGGIGVSFRMKWRQDGSVVVICTGYSASPQAATSDLPEQALSRVTSSAGRRRGSSHS